VVIAVRTERSSEGLEIVKEAETDADRARLRHEADMLVRGAQPGVVDIVSTSPSVLRLRHRGTPLARLGPLAPDQAAAIVRSVAETVASLHDQGVAHRAIDAAHVVVGERGRPRLCGFGSAGDATEENRQHDVAAIGRLLDSLLGTGRDALWSPAHRGMRMAGRRKRALAAFRSVAVAAQRPEPAQRPTARQLAASLQEAFPELALPVPGADDDGARTFATIPDDVDPTADLGWTDDDLSYLAVEDDDGPGDHDDAGHIEADAARVDPYASLADLAGPDDDDRHPSDDTEAPADQRDEAGGREPTGHGAGDGNAAPTPPDDHGGAPTHRVPRVPEAVGEHVDDRTSDVPEPAAVSDPLAPIRIRPGHDEPERRRGPDRRTIVALAAGALVLGLLLGAAVARSVRPFGAGSASVPAADDPNAAAPTTDTGPAPDGPAPTPPTFPPGCAVPDLAGPDVDGDGCPEAVHLDGRVATVGPVQVELGRGGDLVVVADSDCDGVATPVVLRPESGEVFVFPDWSLDEPLEVRSTTVIAGATAIETGEGPCPPVIVSGPDGLRQVVTGFER
jgi:tRNA A-37 threonylcarbamoyl transferase component Bud32